VRTGSAGVGTLGGGVDITEAIAAQSGVLLGYGGHRMAAGFSIQQENIPAFQRGLERAVAKQMEGKEEKAQELAIAGS